MEPKLKNLAGALEVREDLAPAHESSSAESNNVSLTLQTVLIQLSTLLLEFAVLLLILSFCFLAEHAMNKASRAID